MKDLFLILSIALLISCQKEERQAQLFPNYTKSLGVSELPDWLKGDWEVIDRKGIHMPYIYEEMIRMEKTEVWTRKTDTSLEVISLGDYNIKDPAEYWYMWEIYEKTNDGIRYSGIGINKDGSCATNNCDRKWKYYKKKIKD